ncbi:hypothetical protein ACI7BZ_06630 [Xanthobacter sp. AM11]
MPGYGDRRQELVSIGPADPKRFDPEKLKHLPDPFPVWEAVPA